MTTVVPLASKLRATRCAVCETDRPSWQVGPNLRSCDAHRPARELAAAAYQEADGFAPPVPSPVRIGGAR